MQYIKSHVFFRICQNTLHVLIRMYRDSLQVSLGFGHTHQANHSCIINEAITTVCRLLFKVMVIVINHHSSNQIPIVLQLLHSINQLTVCLKMITAFTNIVFIIITPTLVLNMPLYALYAHIHIYIVIYM